MLEDPQAPLAAPTAVSAVLPGCTAPPCLCVSAQGVVDPGPSCAVLGNHILETPRRGIKPTWDSTAQRDAAELSNAAHLASAPLKSPPSLPCPLFPSLKKVVFQKYITWRLVANNLGGRQAAGALLPPSPPKKHPCTCSQVLHASAGSKDETGCSPLSGIRVLPDKARHPVRYVRGLGAAFQGQGLSRHLPSVPKLKGKIRPAQDSALGLLICWQNSKPD